MEKDEIVQRRKKRFGLKNVWFLLIGWWAGLLWLGAMFLVSLTIIGFFLAAIPMMTLLPKIVYLGPSPMEMADDMEAKKIVRKRKLEAMARSYGAGEMIGKKQLFRAVNLGWSANTG